ncbi:MAG: ATP-binding protein [Polyangiaceae bacterium]|nr:ATP-binding protein [Polyangiaceae bacterium]
MIPRSARLELERKLKQFPIVAILGARQVGKTTLARSARPGWTYVDVERPAQREPLLADPEDRLRNLGDQTILDEAQLVPSVLEVLRGFVDEHPNKNGRYLLLGSASPLLMKNIAETLAGRVAFVELGSLTWEEVHASSLKISIDNLWLRGGFPKAALVRDDQLRFDWFDAYSKTFIERDLPVMGVDVSVAQMRKLWAMLAHAQGTQWNASRFGSALGMSYHTVNRYVDILEHAFLIRRLPPFLPNLTKRLTKAPKIYLRDSGLLHYFTGAHSRERLDVNPGRGESWEGFVIEQLAAGIGRYALGAECFYFRTATGVEVDLVVQVGGRVTPFEIKTHTAPGIDAAIALRNFMRDMGCEKGYVIARSAADYSLGQGVTVLAAKKWLGNLPELAKLVDAG